MLGVAWAVLQPLMQMLVFTLIFGAPPGLKSQLPPGLPYAVFVFAGAAAVDSCSHVDQSTGGMSLVNQQHLLTKIYFPRLFVPTAVGRRGADRPGGCGRRSSALLLAATGIVPAWAAAAASAAAAGDADRARWGWRTCCRR